MRNRLRQFGACIAALALAGPTTPAQNGTQVSSTQVSSTPQAGFTLQMNGELVLTNVVARDAKTGEPVRGLKPSDFRIYEDGKPQHIDTFDWENVDMATPLKEATVSWTGRRPEFQQRQQGCSRCQAGRIAQSPTHRDVLRPHLHAA